MRVMISCLYAETLKLKRTLALLLCVVIPLVIAGSLFGMFYDLGTTEGGNYGGGWTKVFQYGLVYWGMLMMPLYVTLQTALVCNMEHTGNQWKHISALPVPRFVVYVAKQLAGFALVGLGSLALVGLVACAGLGLRWLVPGVGLDDPMPLQSLVTWVFCCWVGSWLVTSIQTWISLRWKSFVVSSGVGIAMTIAGVFIVRAEWGTFWPWALSASLAHEYFQQVVLVPELLFGSVGGIVFALIAGIDICRRDVL